MTELNEKKILQKVTGGERVSLSEMMACIKQLEQQKPLHETSNLLNGEWRLIWTSGTKKYQEFSENLSAQMISPLSGRSQIIQRFDTTNCFLENEVRVEWGSLCVAGFYENIGQSKLQFFFKQLQLNLGHFPGVKFPLGAWAKGWLRTTYLDADFHLERGDKGGVSVYIRAN